MKAFLSRMAWGVLLVCVLISGVGLVMYRVLNASGDASLNFITWFKDWGGSGAEKTPPTLPAQPDEVKSYSLFTTVKFGSYQVTTGVRYGSTINQKIQGQWCYLSSDDQLGSYHLNLTLANVDATGIKTTPDFKKATLEQFDLNQVSVNSLIQTHCRFQ